jgi:hypothetical protein
MYLCLPLKQQGLRLGYEGVIKFKCLTLRAASKDFTIKADLQLS